MSLFEDATKAIRDAGGRMTDQRKLIVEVLSQQDEQVDADTLLGLVTEQDATISRATVYRTLNTLADAGLVQRRYLSLDHERQYFELPRVKSDYMLTCRTCHKTIPFQSDLLQQLSNELAKQYGFDSVQVCICATGTCSTCHNEAKGVSA